MAKRGLRPGYTRQLAGKPALSACSGDMLLEALAACAGVTFGPVATRLECQLPGAISRSRPIPYFRLLLKSYAPVGFQEIRLHFDL